MPSSVDQLQMRMSACIDQVASLMSCNRRQLNPNTSLFLLKPFRLFCKVF